MALLYPGRRRITRICVAGAVLALLVPGLPAHAAGASDPPFPFTVHSVNMVAQLIGAGPKSSFAPYAPRAQSINDTTRWGICGGDLGSLMYDSGTAYITLGDNYTSCPPGTGGPGDLQPPDWRSNAVGIIPNPQDFARGLHITRWVSQDGRHATEVIPSQHNAGNCQATQKPECEVTAIPTYGFASQQHLFLAYMSVHNWGVAAVWTVNYSSFAMSADHGKTWHIEKNTIHWGAASNFAEVAVAPDPDGTHLLFFGIPAGRFGAVKLMRVPNNWRAVLTPGAYQYFTGTNQAGQPRWSSDPAHAAAVADAPVGELSVIYDPGLHSWLMTYLQGGNDQVVPSSDDLVIRSAPHYWGPWSQTATLVTQAQYAGLYGAYMNPHFLADGGHTIYFVMSWWMPYCVFWMKASVR